MTEIILYIVRVHYVAFCYKKKIGREQASGKLVFFSLSHAIIHIISPIVLFLNPSFYSVQAMSVHS